MGDKRGPASVVDESLRASSQGSTWSGVIFVCSKCMKRQQRENLRGELKQLLKREGRRDVRVVACGCLDLCPKHGVTVAVGDELASPSPRLRVINRDEDAETLLRAIPPRLHVSGSR